MRNSFLLILFLCYISSACAGPQQQSQTGIPGGERWQAPAGLSQWPIWPQGAPDMSAVPMPAETVFSVTKPMGHSYTGIANVSEPTMTVFPPRAASLGGAMVVFPGGGFQILAIDIEGTEICDWITAHGITCVLLKYRVPKSNHYWDKECKCHVTPAVPFALQDAERAIRLVRAQAQSLQIDPNKIGVIGFSAGGYLVAQTSNLLTSSYTSQDEVDQISARPDFAVALYPGHLCRAGAVLDPALNISAATPPTFLLQAWDDPVDKICNSTLYAQALANAGVAAEVHLFAKGGHAFGLRDTPHAIASWPMLLERWLQELGIVAAAEVGEIPQ